jgi:hypothetical protein
MTAPLKTIKSPQDVAGQSLAASPCSARRRCKITVRPFSHPNKPHLEFAVRFDWPSYAETHFTTRAQAERYQAPNAEVRHGAKDADSN